MTAKESQLVNLLREVFVSSTLSKWNGEPANIADALANVANGLFAVAKAIEQHEKQPEPNGKKKS